MKNFEIPLFYRSPLITAIKNKRKADDKLKKDFTPTRLDFGSVEIYLARHFGFCYGVENAIENVISFDRLDTALSKHLDDIFGGHGINFSHVKSSMKSYGRSEGGVSTPKTRASEPKHGKIDPNNVPHVGE